MSKWEAIGMIGMALVIAVAVCVYEALADRHRHQTLRACIAAGRPTAECQKLAGP